MRVPPVWVRRVLLAPLVIVLAVALLVSSPLWLLVALAFTSLVPGRFRLPRVVWLVIVYLCWDAAMLLCLFGLWVASGFGMRLRTAAFVDAHYRLARALLDALFWVFRAVLRLDIVTEGDAAWGLRDRDEVVALARSHGLTLTLRTEMPANNISLLFRRT